MTVKDIFRGAPDKATRRPQQQIWVLATYTRTPRSGVGFNRVNPVRACIDLGSDRLPLADGSGTAQPTFHCDDYPSDPRDSAADHDSVVCLVRGYSFESLEGNSDITVLSDAHPLNDSSYLGKRPRDIPGSRITGTLSAKGIRPKLNEPVREFIQAQIRRNRPGAKL